VSWELRCGNKLHGELIDEDTFEVKCGSRYCGARPGVVVMHQFNLRTRECVTKRYKDPGKEVSHDAGNHAPVRTA
jgi:hypothetical protein